ncbi:MAG: RsbRD N-terminal domain-containing protein [Syntrophobacteraceae bacterium]
MNLDSLLLERKKPLLQNWFDALLGSYAPETARLLKKETNQFANPVGHTYRVALTGVLDEFLGENRLETLSPLLDRILRIRAVQEFSPSSALAFILVLKKLARDLVQAEVAQGSVGPAELFDFDERVDGLALAAMDVYSKCRNTLYEVRIREIKDRTQRLLHRAEIIGDIPPLKPEDEQQ